MTQPAAVSTEVDEEAFVALKDEIAAYVAEEGEAWTRRIEEERAVPPSLRDELQARGYLSIAAPREYGGRGIPFSRWLELLELFSMSHAALRMTSSNASGTWMTPILRLSDSTYTGRAGSKLWSAVRSPVSNAFCDGCGSRGRPRATTPRRWVT